MKLEIFALFNKNIPTTYEKEKKWEKTSMNRFVFNSKKYMCWEVLIGA